MASTIHYFGKIKSQDAIRDIQEEFREIAFVSGWTHEMVDNVFTQEGEMPGVRLHLKGIRITLSKNITPLQLTFDKDGYLSHIYYEKTPKPSRSAECLPFPDNSCIRSIPARP